MKKDANMFDGKFKLMVIELLLLKDVLNGRENKGYGLKDVRLIEKASEVISALIPEQSKDMTPQQAGEWGNQIVEVELTQPVFETIKIKYINFSGFLNDVQGRQVVIALAEKLGIK